MLSTVSSFSILFVFPDTYVIKNYRLFHTFTMEEENEDCLLRGAPPSFSYIPDFISEAEEANLMRHIEQTPGPR